MPKLTKRIVDGASPGAIDHFVWCTGTRGFGIRIYPSGRKIFVAQVRVGRRLRRIKIGAFGPFTVDQARDQAEEIIRAAHKGRDPQREKRDARAALTVAELCDAYLQAAHAKLVITRFGRPKRASTIAIDVGRINRHILPLIGSIPANDLTRTDIQRMVDDIGRGKTTGRFKSGKKRGLAVVRGGSGSATRIAELLGGIYSWAERRGFVSCANPVRGVEKMRGQPRDRVLSTGELRALGNVLSKTQCAAGSQAVRLIALTGLRRSEAFGLQWREVDFGHSCLRLAETKTGKSTRPLGSSALNLLRTIPQTSMTWVFPNASHTGSADLKKAVADLFDYAGLQSVRSHDLRRTFATAAAELGFGDSTIGDMLGHARRGVTVRHYIRPPDSALLVAADRTSAHIESLLMGEPRAAVYDFKKIAQLRKRDLMD